MGLCGAPAGRNYDDRWVLGGCNAADFMTIIRCLPGAASGRFWATQEHLAAILKYDCGRCTVQSKGAEMMVWRGDKCDCVDRNWGVKCCVAECRNVVSYARDSGGYGCDGEIEQLSPSGFARADPGFSTCPPLALSTIHFF